MGCYLLSFYLKIPLLVFKSRCNLFQTADSYFWRETLQTARDESSLNRFEPTSLTEWEECVIVAGNALPQLVQWTIFQLDYASSFLRVVIWEPLGSFIMTIWMSQPGILANRFVPSMRLVGLAVVVEMAVFTLDRTVCVTDTWLQEPSRCFHNLKTR